MIRRSALAALAALALAACDKPAPTAAPAPSKPSAAVGPLRVAVVPKGTTHDFWKSVHAGAKKAEKELGGVTVTFQGPTKEDDRDQQVSLVQNLISAKYDAIVLAPLDSRALVGPVRDAAAAKIPVVIIDSDLAATAGEDFVSFVATDNRAGGRLAGQRMGRALAGQGKVLLLRYQEGSASTELRERGFTEGLSDFPGIRLIDPKRYAGPTRGSAQDAAENLLVANPDIAGVFCPNESSAYGMLLALKSRGLAGKVVFIGFDASDAAVVALREGHMEAIVLQNPIRMGYLGVKTAVEHLRGVKVDLRVDTGVMLVDKATMDTPEAGDLLSPNLDELLRP
ncbi:MAG: substrate-binding domain-containing protein [Phycisphaerae bacterium]|nr:substrate-binding domain-containing protein [Phycisphaerae bacterium]